jgi:hypothetical protein
MSLWGRNDQAVTANSTTTKESSNGAPIGTYALVKGDQVNRTDGANAHFGNTSTGSRASVDSNMYLNTTIGAFQANLAVGVFGVDTTEMGLTSGPLGLARVTYGGTGYTANATVTLANTNAGVSLGVANAFANTTAGVGGKITALNISTIGSGYITPPIVTISAPTSQTIYANTTNVNNAADVILIATANSRYQVGDRLYYGVPTSNTAIPNLTGNTYYYVTFANTSALAVSATKSGANVDLNASTATPNESHSLTGDTATGIVLVRGAKAGGVAHAGWVVRKEGTGGRAGRVHYETLVAMGSLGATNAVYGTPATTADGNDDIVFHDS